MTSWWPAETSRPMRGPRDSARTLEVMVVDQRMSSTCSRNSLVSGKLSFAAACERQSKRQTVRSCGVVSTFTQNTSSTLVKRASVKVPPTSMSTVHTRASRGLQFQIFQQLGRMHGPSEKRFHVEECGLVLFRVAGGHGAIGEKDRPVIQEKGVAERGFDADIGGDAREKKKLDAAHAQQGIESGSGKAAVARFYDDEVSWLGSEFIDDGEVPGAFGEDFSFQFRPRVHQTHGEFLVPIRGPGPSAIAEVGLVAHLEIDDRNLRGAGGVQDVADGVSDAGGAGNVQAGDVQHAARAGEGVLHVHDEDGGFLEIDFEGVGFGVESGHGSEPITFGRARPQEFFSPWRPETRGRRRRQAKTKVVKKFS